MVEHVQNYDVLEKCAKDILSIIKPTEDDRNKRLHAIQEIVNSIYLVGGLGDAVVKPFGSFLSELYAKSGDLDVSVELPDVSGFSTSKEKKQNLLRKLMKALQISGVARDVNFIPTARVPVLQYVSNHFGISCDISINNYPGRIKSKVLYWINTLDGRVGDMVLLVKEWAKAQNINDPKNGTLNSYSLCLLVLFHFQTCKPAILPPMKELFDVNILGESGPYNEKVVDEICAANIAKFRRQNIGQRNQSSLSYLLATFFEKHCLQFGSIVVHSSEAISTYMGQLQQIRHGSPYWPTKSFCLFVEDPFKRYYNAAGAVDVPELQRIVRAFKHATSTIFSGRPADRNELLSLLCTPEVGSKLGARGRANRYANPAMSHRFIGIAEHVSANPSDIQHRQSAQGPTGSRLIHSRYANPAMSHRFIGTVERVSANPSDIQHRQSAQGSTGSRLIHSPRGYDSGRQAAAPYQSQHRRDRQASRHDGSASNSRSQASSSRTAGQYW